MFSLQTFGRLIVIGFMVAIGYALAKGIYTESAIGICLALVSLGAGLYLIYLIGKIKERG